MRLSAALALVLSTAWVTLACNESYDFKTDFTKKTITRCIKSEFIKSYPIVLAGQDEDQCAVMCRAAGDKCQGFEFAVSDCKCNLYIFDQCDHNINVQGNCTREASIWIRNQPGLPKGDLCPEGYGSQLGSSLYKIVGADSWTQGKTRCAAEKGLTKYADANDKAEVDHMHAVRDKFDSMKSFYVGGRLTSSLPLQYHWVSCNKPIVREVWGTHQPSDNQCCTNIWFDHTSYWSAGGGLDDTSESYSNLNHALCECVNPFV